MRFLTRLAHLAAAWTCFFCGSSSTGNGRCTNCGT